MTLEKVIYKQGDNRLFDYFILSDKSKIKFDKEGLAYKFDQTEDSASLINQASIDSNFDLVLEKRLKNGEVTEPVLCNFEDIEVI